MTDRGGHGKVVDMDSMRGTGRESHLQAFLDYWNRMRRAGDVPRRADIDPRGIEPLLENALIAERIAPGLARLRIAGVHLSDLMGMEVRGMPLSAFIEPEARDGLADALTELFERPAMVRLDLTSSGGLGRPALSGTLVLLPLRSDLGDISRALGCLVTHGPVGRAPRRFAITGRQFTRIDLTRDSAPVPARGFADAQRDFSPRDGHPSERPYLRLVR